MAIVVHTMAGTLASTDSWFANPASQVSSHYGVGLHGDRHQYVHLGDAAWANGVLEPGNRWAARFGTAWPNGRTVSIETEDTDANYPGHDAPVSDAEYAGVLACSQAALERHRATLEVVTSHHVISPQSRPNCCGARWIQSGRLAHLAAELGLELFL